MLHDSDGAGGKSDRYGYPTGDYRQSGGSGCPILALTVDEKTRRLLALVWGVETALVPVVDSTDKLLNLARSMAWELGYVEEEDLAVVTAGIPVGISGSTNLIKVLRF